MGIIVFILIIIGLLIMFSCKPGSVINNAISNTNIKNRQIAIAGTKLESNEKIKFSTNSDLTESNRLTRSIRYKDFSYDMSKSSDKHYTTNESMVKTRS